MMNFSNRQRRKKTKDTPGQDTQYADYKDDYDCNDTPWWLEQANISEKPHNLQGFPVKVVEFEGRGRGLVVERNVRAGELLLCAARMGSAIRVKQDCLWCHECLQHRLEDWSPPLPLACIDCEAVWCCTGESNVLNPSRRTSHTGPPRQRALKAPNSGASTS